jgi:hypothetical protein
LLRDTARSKLKSRKDIVRLANQLGLAVASGISSTPTFSAANPPFKEADMQVMDPVGVIEGRSLVRQGKPK